METTTRLAIIWWWAAGMMVAARLLEHKNLPLEIHLFEKNSKLGAKVIMSWGGRCNLTTGFFKLHDILPKYPRWAAFLTPALKLFGPKAIRRRFEAHGIPCKQEEDGRIFPVSDDGNQVVRVFEELFAQDNRLHLHLQTSIQTIQYHTGSFVLTDQKHTTTFDHVVLTTGGNAYAHTGSSGDGYAWARTLWHTITPLGPSLNSFITAQKRLHACSGISVPDALLKTETIQTRWPVLLTHFGISGPAVFAFSSHIPYAPIDQDHPYACRLQPVASTWVAQRTDRFLSHITTTPKKELATSLREFFPKKLANLLVKHHGYALHTTFGNLSREQRIWWCTLLWEGIPLQLTQRRPWDEFVTAWGVALDEVDPTSGQSRLVPGLYFAGEILDIDGYTGGYNLTASRAMGKLVGDHLAHQYAVNN